MVLSVFFNEKINFFGLKKLCCFDFCVNIQRLKVFSQTRLMRIFSSILFEDTFSDVECSHKNERTTRFLKFKNLCFFCFFSMKKTKGLALRFEDLSFALYVFLTSRFF